jgi:uncharacterized OB-fold protein
MSDPESRIRAAQTRARIERVIARLPEVTDERLEGIEDNLFELAGLCARCCRCGHLYRPYIERCAACVRPDQPEVTPSSARGRGLSPRIGSQ